MPVCHNSSHAAAAAVASAVAAANAYSRCRAAAIAAVAAAHRAFFSVYFAQFQGLCAQARPQADSSTNSSEQALRTVDNSGSCSDLTPKRGSFSPFLLKLDFSFLGLDLTPEMTDIGEMSFDGDCMDTCLVVVAEKKGNNKYN